MARKAIGGRLPNWHYRSRDALTTNEVDRVFDACKKFHRDAERNEQMLRLMLKYALRVSELTGMKWSQILFDHKEIYVIRLKNSDSRHYPLSDERIAFLKKLKKNIKYPSPYVFTTPQGKPFDRMAIYHITRKAAEFAELGHLNVHTHTWRHTAAKMMRKQENRSRPDTAAYLGINERNLKYYDQPDSTDFEGYLDGY